VNIRGSAATVKPGTQRTCEHRKMKKNFKIILSAFLILSVVFGFWFAKTRSVNNTSSLSSSQESFVVLKVNQEEGSKSFDISEFVGKTALEATESKVEVISNGEGVNAYVVSVDGRGADPQKREFWEFNVNGSQAQVGAGSYIVQNHDEIEWKISNY